MRKLLHFLVVFLIIVGFVACSIVKPSIKPPISNKVIKQESYNTTILLFYSNHDKKVVEQTIKIPKEIPMNFTTNLAYSKIFPWDKYICEIRFSESKNSLPFYSIFAFHNCDRVLAIAKVNSLDTTKRLKENVLFWVYKNGNPIKATIEEFKKALIVIEAIQKEPV
jgi:hypothetical protein